jgi:hypothetical protein
MATPHEVNGSPQLPADRSEIERLEANIRQLQQERDQLLQALAEMELQRDQYRCLFLQQARAAREFEDLDLPTLQAMSAGPVEPL